MISVDKDRDENRCNQAMRFSDEIICEYAEAFRILSEWTVADAPPLACSVAQSDELQRRADQERMLNNAREEQTK